MVPAFVYVFFAQFERIYLSLLIFLLAGLTDVADGYIARRNNWTSNLGKLLDPLADKLMQCAVLVCFALKNIIPWWLPAAFMLKELFMIGGAIIVLKKIKVTVKSKWYGKATTAVFYAIAFYVLAVRAFEINVSDAVALGLFALALVMTFVSMTLYIMDTLRVNAGVRADSGFAAGAADLKEK